jgi:LCP family protein required for cell wall assembly
MSEFQSPLQDEGRAAQRRRTKGKRKKVLKIVAFTAAGTLVVGGAGVAYAYTKLNGNIKTVSLSTGKDKVNLGTEKPDAFGRTPLNILLLGSDTRDTAADCAIGGDCGDGGAGANADVEMLVHLSADRTNATVMSIPRDTMTNTPACTDPTTGASTSGYYGQINSTLKYGPACTVEAVHQLTGIPIDHFAMIDFSGVVNMSDAIGGVNVCVDNNVYDPDSGLKLSKGTHTLQGLSALQFLRTRHGFGDGSDLGRTYAQHIFITQMINKLKSAGTLTDPVALYDLADAATKALTVDTGLGSITKLIGLATDLNKVPAGRVTFTTMPNYLDPADTNRVLVSSSAQALFRSIIDDQSLTAASSTPAAPTAGATPTATATSPTPSAPATAPTSAVPSPTASALIGANAQTGDQVGTCAQVGDQYTVELNGVGMTPIQAYSNSPGVPNSAP